jgi:hypothetical protein
MSGLCDECMMLHEMRNIAASLRMMRINEASK